MPLYTIQCSYARYYARSFTVDGATLEEAVETAIAKANDSGDALKPLHEDGDTFVDAVAEGAHQSPWVADQLPVPHRFTEIGVLTRSHRPPPDTEARDKTIHVDVEQGIPVAVHLPEALNHVRVIVRDFDTEGHRAADVAELPADENGRPYWETHLSKGE